MEHDVETIASATCKTLHEKFPNVADKDIAIFEFDMRHNFLRILSYGISAHCPTQFLHEGNVRLYKQMFEAVGLPVDFFTAGIEAAKAEVLKIADPGDKASVEATFDYFISLIH